MFSFIGRRKQGYKEPRTGKWGEKVAWWDSTLRPPYSQEGWLLAQAKDDPKFRGLERENLTKVLLTSILLQLISRDEQLTDEVKNGNLEPVIGLFIGKQGGTYDLCLSPTGRVILGNKLFSVTQKGEGNSFNLHCFLGAQASGKIQCCHHSTWDENYNSYLWF